MVNCWGNYIISTVVLDAQGSFTLIEEKTLTLGNIWCTFVMLYFHTIDILFIIAQLYIYIYIMYIHIIK